MDPLDAHWRMLMVRERELQVAYAEYSFLAMCGGVRSEDVARLRANVTGILPPPVVIKIEDVEDLPVVAAKEIMPLKQMVKDLLVGEMGPVGDSQLNALCRSVSIQCGDTVRSFKKHKASYVHVDDKPTVQAALVRVLRARMETFDDM